MVNDRTHRRDFCSPCRRKAVVGGRRDSRRCRHRRSVRVRGNIFANTGTTNFGRRVLHYLSVTRFRERRLRIRTGGFAYPVAAISGRRLRPFRGFTTFQRLHDARAMIHGFTIYARAPKTKCQKRARPRQ